jgi:hypothetical protein
MPLLGGDGIFHMIFAPSNQKSPHRRRMASILPRAKPTLTQELKGYFWRNKMTFNMSESAGWPSTTGNPSGGGRDNAPSRK